MTRLLLALTASLSLACACGGQPSPPPSAPASESVLTASPRDEITALDNQISSQLATLDLSSPTADDVAYARLSGDLEPLPASTYASSTCPAPSTEPCTDVCTLADSICTNARRICELASQLSDDPYATDRCDAGRLSCSRATDRCCTC